MSIEKWMADTQQTLNALAAQVEKGWAEYEIVEKEAFEILNRGGWLGMERHLTGPQERLIHQIAKSKGEDEAHEILRKLFSTNDWNLLAAMIEQWVDIPYLRNREKIVRDALAAHRARQYTLSVPALLPLAEGLSAEIVGSAVGRQNVAKAVARDWKAREQEVWAEIYLDLVTNVFYKYYDFDKDPAPYLNRNGILHGRV